MSNEIEKYFVRRLQTVLQEYLKDFSQNNVAKFSLGISNNISLENLSIKKDVLWKFHIPMYILDGKIGRINIRMPFNYKAKTSHMVIETVDLTVIPISEASISVLQKEKSTKSELNQDVSGSEGYKKSKLRLWEDKMIKFFEALSPPTWIQKIVDNIYDNMCITIKKFTLNFQSHSVMGYHTIMRIKFDELVIQPTNSEWITHFSSETKFLYKMIQLTKFRISLSASNKQDVMKEQELHILHPIDICLKVCQQKQQMDVTEPIIKLMLDLKSPMIFMLNKDQKDYLIQLNSLLKNLDIIQDNFHFRPEVPVKKNEGNWWKYAIQAIIQKHKKYKLDLNFASSRIVLMKHYIALYKRKQNIIHVPWLTQFTSQDENKFQMCEKVLPLKDLLKYREWAFTEIHLEAKRYFNSSKDGSGGKEGRSVKPLLEIWTNTINNENAFVDKQKKQDDDIPVELDDCEKINLYEVLERDQAGVLNSYLQGVNNSAELIDYYVDLNINSIFLLLLEPKPEKHLYYSPKNLRIYSDCICAKCVLQAKMDPNKSFDSLSLSKRRNHNYSDVSEHANLNESFQTAKGNDDDKDSFESDLDDLNDVGNSQAEKQKMNQKQEQTNVGNKLNQPIFHSPSKSQRLFLILEAQKLKAILKQRRDNRIESIDPNNISLGGLQIMSPGYLNKYMINDSYSSYASYDRIDSERSNDPNKKQNPQKQQWLNFMSDIFEIVSTKDPIFYNSETNFKYLLDFLESNNMRHISSFLYNYEQDKNYFQDFTDKDYEKYEQYFESQHDLFLHFSESDFQSFKTQPQKSTTLGKAHAKVIELIKRYVFPIFLEEYGEWVLPLCIDHIKHKLNDDNKHSGSEQLIKIVFSIRGKAPEFRIVQKKNISQTKTKWDDQYDKADQKKETSTFTFNMELLHIHLTNRGFQSLLNYFETDNQQTSDYYKVISNHMLMECINKSQSLGQKQEADNKIQFDVRSKGLKLNIYQESLFNLHRSETQLKLQGFTFVTLLDHTPTSPLYDLFNKHQFYEKLKLQITNICIQHKFHKHKKFQKAKRNSRNGERSPNGKQYPSQQVHQKILELRVNSIIVRSLKPNHAILTDLKLFIQIPFFKVEVSSDITGFLELISVFKSKPQPTRESSSKAFLKGLSPHGYTQKNDSFLLAEMKGLYHDHKINSKACRHCIMKYRKSILILNLIFGDVSKVTSKLAEKSWFNMLEALNYGSVTYEREQKLGIELSAKVNSICSDQTSFVENYTKISIPLMIITYDQGYFRDNLTVHCQQTDTSDDSFITPLNKQKEVQKSQVNPNPPQHTKNPSFQKLAHEVIKSSRNSHTPLASKPTQGDLSHSEINNIRFIPLIPKKIEEVIGLLDYKHFFYCKDLENLFTMDLNDEFSQQKMQQQQQESMQLQQQQPQQRSQIDFKDGEGNFFLLAFVHIPKRTDITGQVEGRQRPKSTKTQVFFRLKEISIKHGQHFSTCVIPTIVKNIQFASKFIENARKNIYTPHHEGKKDPPTPYNTKPDFLQQLDDLIILFSIDKIAFETSITQLTQKQSIVLKIENILIQYNLALMDINNPQSQKVMDISIPFRHAQSLIPLNLVSNPRKSNKVKSKPLSIFSCRQIMLNFNNEGVICLFDLNLMRKEQKIRFLIDKISIVNGNQSLMTIPYKSTRSRQPRKRKVDDFEETKPIALKVVVEYLQQSQTKQTKIFIDSVDFSLSKTKIQQYLLSMNIYFLILVSEFREYKSFLKKVVYVTKYEIPQHPIQVELFKVMKHHSKEDEQDNGWQVSLYLGEVNIRFMSKDRSFCKFYLKELEVEPNNLKEKTTRITIKDIGFHSIDDEKEGPNLFQPRDEEDNILIQVVKSRRHLTADIENIKFKVVFKYLNELTAFANEITKELIESKQKILGDELKKPRKRQILEELERQHNDQLKLVINLRNSEIDIPKNSTSSESLIVRFDDARITKSIKEQRINVPILKTNPMPEIVDNLVVDMEENMQQEHAFLNVLDAKIKDVQLITKDDNGETLILQSRQIENKLYTPMLNPCMFEDWDFNTQVEVNVQNLELESDMGRLMTMGDLVKENTDEKSDLYEKQTFTTDKVNIELNISSLNVEQQTFTYTEQDDKDFYRPSDDEESSEDF